MLFQTTTKSKVYIGVALGIVITLGLLSYATGFVTLRMKSKSTESSSTKLYGYGSNYTASNYSYGYGYNADTAGAQKITSIKINPTSVILKKGQITNFFIYVLDQNGNKMFTSSPMKVTVNGGKIIDKTVDDKYFFLTYQAGKSKGNNFKIKAQINNEKGKTITAYANIIVK